MSSAPNLAERTFPARVAELGFSIQLPEAWVSHRLPDEDVDWSDPTRFVPLAVVTPVHSAIIAAVGARPAHAEGELHGWAWYHLQHQGLQPRTVGRAVLAGNAAVAGEGGQATEAGPMIVWFAFMEDGGRLVNLSLTAPEEFETVARPVWNAMVASFRLTTPRGSRFEVEPQAIQAPAAQIPEPWLEPTPMPPPVAEDEPVETESSPEDAGSASSEAPGEPASEVGTSADEAPAAAAERPTPKPPGWRERARQLEREDRLAEAEALLRDSIPHLSFAAEIAELYRERMRRMQEERRGPEAREAYEKARQFIRFYASLATSGGEGMALSAERDDFLKGLETEFKAG